MSNDYQARGGWGVTYSAFHRVNGPGHPLDRRLGGLLSGSCTLGTSGRRLQPKKFGYDPVPSSGIRLGGKHTIPYMTPPLLAEGERPPT
jgi:hypothetical protein